MHSHRKPHASALRERMIELASGRRVYALECGPPLAAGEEFVVLESGLGGGAALWALVMEDLAAAGIPSLAYDRAGYGPSDPAPGTRDVEALADDLDALLEAFAADVRPARVLLVAHSWGGLVVRTLAARWAQKPAAVSRPELAGLVLVDPSDENEDWALSPLARVVDRAHALAHPWLARSGLLALAARIVLRALPARERALAVEEVASVASARAIAVELRGVRASLVRMRAEPPRIVRVPLVVITAGRYPRLLRGVRGGILRAHRSTVGAAPRGRHVIARLSGHQVMLSEPGRIAQQVLRLLAR